MNILYLLKVLNTNKISELVQNMDLAPLDINLALWGAIDRGEVEVNEDEDTITALKDAEPSSDPDLTNKLLRVIQHYASKEINITRGTMNNLIKDPTNQIGYGWHEYVMAIEHLIDQGLIVQAVVDVPEAKKNFTDKKGRKKTKVVRPAHKFAFLCLAENADVNEEWNATEVNKWIAMMESDKVK